MKKLLLILLILPLGLVAQEYNKLYIDTLQQSYVINDTLMGERYIINHTYGYDTVQLLEDIERLSFDFEQRTQQKADMIQNYNQELLDIYLKKQRLIRILDKIREQ